MENIIGRITLETRHCDDNENGKGHGKGNSKRHSRENVTTWHDSGLSDHIPDIMDIMQIVLCRDWLKDVLRRGVVSRRVLSTDSITQAVQTTERQYEYS